MNKLRFHLASGKNFMKWQVTEGSKVSYFDPDSTQFRMTGCELKNNRNVANKIYGGENKRVCAYVQFQTIEILKSPVPVGTKISYNPRRRPYWCIEELGTSMDNMILMELFSSGSGVFLPGEAK